MLYFDVSVDLTTLPPDMPPARAIELVLSAVRAIPGAGWGSVEDCRGAPPGLRWVTTYAPGRSTPMDGGDWEGIRETVAAAVIVALA